MEALRSLVNPQLQFHDVVSFDERSRLMGRRFQLLRAPMAELGGPALGPGRATFFVQTMASRRRQAMGRPVFGNVGARSESERRKTSFSGQALDQLPGSSPTPLSSHWPPGPGHGLAPPPGHGTPSYWELEANANSITLDSRRLGSC